MHHAFSELRICGQFLCVEPQSRHLARVIRG
jgi:hypothetical protein